MKTYPLYLNEAQLRLVLDLLNTSVDDIGQQIAATLNGIQAETDLPRASQAEKRRKPVPVRRAEAIERLGKTHPEAAKALAAWKNKSDGVLGWDRWVRANHPSAGAELWPSEARIAVGVKRAIAFTDRIKPIRNHA